MAQIGSVALQILHRGAARRDDPFEEGAHLEGRRDGQEALERCDRSSVLDDGSRELDPVRDRGGLLGGDEGGPRVEQDAIRHRPRLAVEDVAQELRMVFRTPSSASACAMSSARSGCPTPTSWYAGRAGFVRGPSRLKAVRMPRARRTGITFAIAGWNAGAKMNPIPASSMHRATCSAS